VRLLGLAVVLAVAACSSAAPPAPPPAAPAPAACGWYTATAAPGQIVNVTATGPGCHDRTVVDRLTADSDRPWTTTALIPGAMGTLLAQLARGRTTVRVWFTGPPTGQAGPLAGRIADAFQAAGWRPVA
jgi:hypothetical protein